MNVFWIYNDSEISQSILFIYLYFYTWIVLFYEYYLHTSPSLPRFLPSFVRSFIQFFIPPLINSFVLSCMSSFLLSRFPSLLTYFSFLAIYLPSIYIRLSLFSLSPLLPVFVSPFIPTYLFLPTIYLPTHISPYLLLDLSVCLSVYLSNYIFHFNISTHICLYIPIF